MRRSAVLVSAHGAKMGIIYHARVGFDSDLPGFLFSGREGDARAR